MLKSLKKCYIALVELLAKKRQEFRFKKLIASGLYARDIVPIKIFDEKKARLALLCVCKKQVFAVICLNSKKSSVPIVTLLGHSLQAKEGIVLYKKSDWVKILSREYLNLKVPLVVAKDVVIRNVS